MSACIIVRQAIVTYDNCKECRTSRIAKCTHSMGLQKNHNASLSSAITIQHCYKRKNKRAWVVLNYKCVYTHNVQVVLNCEYSYTRTCKLQTELWASESVSDYVQCICFKCASSTHVEQALEVHVE